MWGWRKQLDLETREKQKEAENAIAQSRDDYLAMQKMKPLVEDTVQGHIRLQLENHFAERIWIAYRGDYS